MGATRIGRLEAAGLRLGKVGRSRIEDIIRKGRAGLAAPPQLWVLAGLCLALISFEQVHALAFRAPTLRAIIETEVTLCALAAACLFGLSFGRRRRLRDLVLVGALLELAVVDLLTWVLPSAISADPPGLESAAPTFAGLFVALAIAVGMWAGLDRQIGGGRKPLVVAIIASLLGAAVAELGGALVADQMMGGAAGAHGVAAAMHQPIGVASALGASALLIAVAIRTAGSDREVRTGVSLLIAAGLILLAAAPLNYLVLPTPGIGWVTACEGLRFAGLGLILAAALRGRH